VKVTKRKLSPAATAGIGVGIAVVLALAGWFLLVSPQRSRASSLDTEIVAVEEQITAARAAALAADGVEPIVSADLFRLSKALPEDLDQAGVLLEINRVATETGILFEQIVPQPVVPSGAPNVRAQPIELVFTGNFYELSDFLYRLRNLVTVQSGKLHASGRLFAVDKLSFSEATSRFPDIKAVIRVSAFIYGNGPAAVPAPSAAPVGATTAATTTGTTDTTATTSTTTTPTPETPAAPEAVGAP
jgi:Tfp pilus assembly protein PilO